MPKIPASFRRRCVPHLLQLSLAALALQAGAQELGIPQASDMQQRQSQAGIGANAPVFLMAAVPLSAQGKFSVYSSSDGVTFTTLASEAHAPAGPALAEPSIVRHDGQYYAVYAQGAGLGIARSADLKKWETLNMAPLALPGGMSDGRPVSAPRWVREANGTLKVVLAAGTQTFMVAPDAGFTAWSAPQAVQGLAGGASIIATEGGYTALVRNAASGVLEVATAPALAGPWTVAQQGSGPGASAGGQSLVRLADGAWRAYFADADADGRRYWYADSRDLRTWSPRAQVGGVSGMVGSASVIPEERKAFAAATKPKGQPKKVSWDQHSLMVDGKRIVVWSGEVHPFRLPNPSLWRDVIQKMKAVGFNGIAFYFDWGYHSPAPGVYDFNGIRNVERAIEIAEEEGMYIIARTGPYVNAELTGGGYPGWMFRNRAEARTDDPAYLAASDEWMTQINAIIARHQVTTGGGNVIAYQLENELGKVEPKHVRQMEHLAKKARADGITVPFFHNAAGRLPDWAPKDSAAPWANKGPTDIYAFDGYPGGSCNVFADPSGPNKAPDWGIYAQPGPKAGSLSSPNTPGFAAELGAGWFDYWGSNGTYECTAERQGKGFQRVFYGTNLINRITIHNVYMTFGGTSWGWLAGPVVYTSYDYGAPISEDRGLRPKALALKQQGMMVQAAEQALAQMDKGPVIATSSDKVKVYHNVNPKLGAHVLLAVHSPSDLLTDDSFTFDLATKDGSYRVPLRLNGQDAKMLLASYPMERQHLVYSSSELQTHFNNGERDIAVLHGRGGEAGETVLRFTGAPKVEVLAGKVASSYDAAKGDLKLTYTHDGLARVRITGGGRAPLLLLLADEKTSQQFWTQKTPAGQVLQLTPAMVRSATLAGGRLALTGDTTAASTIEIWGPQFSAATFNGEALSLGAQPDGSFRSNAVAGPAAVKLPDLAALPWTRRAGSPEAQPGFDDAAWVKADNRASAAQTWTMPERGQPTLAMSDYGFHHGDVWYRGHVDITDRKTNQLELFIGAGGAGMAQVWIDGRFVGQHEMDTGRSFPETTDSVKLSLRGANELKPGKHVIAVMVRNNSHNWNLMADDYHREARGLISASLTSKGGKRFGVPIAWRIQGRRGGETLADVARGPLNNGGLHGEREGWHLPSAGNPGAGWTAAKPTDAPPAPGTYWVRTSFDLDLPKGHDVQLGLAFGDTSKPRSERENRALIFVNGWNMGQFIAHIGPQRTFVIPPGILNPNGRNTIALAVTTDGRKENALEPVRLVNLRTARGGVPLEMVATPQDGRR
ncbi:beta-galactosidase [Pseudoduganella umbonata]|uniref:beta-galactosidase n=1 Tax=Pseudoduganella umbonata TaxID=864828 RepID=A0A4P8HM62_9BURK|nr:beta-galactosidase [Pseudoduganella umbonata]MBB3222739.1 beta-galactosidase GanA [Pseudoduganella umbonata]QCP10767.1 beta-galactosidase [Pseudoduganella umbonata]